MSVWQQYDKKSLTSLSEKRLMIFINVMTKNDIIEWLSWNDPNGIYNDAQSFKELGNVMSKDEGIEILLRQVRENREVRFVKDQLL